MLGFLSAFDDAGVVDGAAECGHGGVEFLMAGCGEISEV